MKSVMPGCGTSPPEITNISAFGLWLLLDDKEHFLAYADFPWFRRATVGQILNVELLGPEHLYWPELDVDLSVASLDEPASHPLLYKSSDAQDGDGATAGRAAAVSGRAPARVAETGEAYGGK